MDLITFHNDELHGCQYSRGAFAVAICTEQEDGRLILSQEDCRRDVPVNFCPFCGYEAKVGIDAEVEEYP